MSVAITEDHRSLAETVSGFVQKREAKAAARALLETPAEAFYGLAFSRDGTQLFCSGSSDENIRVFHFADGKLDAAEPVPVRDVQERGVPAGLAVSADGPEGLQQTFAKSADKAGFPFPIVSDHALDTFRSYRAYDDFENMALHGTFLVDGAGRVRWQNISYQPFKDAAWLLEESKRLLSIPVSQPAATAAVK